jgi:thiamine biosynthesis lipoprotein
MSQHVLTNRRDVMGGEAVITVVGGSRKLLDDAFSVAEACDAAWSRFRGDSEIGILNHSAGQRTVVSPLTVALVAEMIEGFTLTSGEFNPTLLPAVFAVGYEKSLVREGHVTELPTHARVFDSLEGIVITSDSVQLPAGMTLDSGGIGKGFAADLIVAAVMNSGARGVMVSMSGDIVVSGESPDPGGWRLGVENPFDESQHVEIVRLTEGAVVTSSQRKNRFERGHHLIDPVTRRSAQTTVQTVSVIAKTGARAEVLAKSGFLRKTADYLKWLPVVGAAGLVIEADGRRFESPNWASYR